MATIEATAEKLMDEYFRVDGVGLGKWYRNNNLSFLSRGNGIYILSFYWADDKKIGETKSLKASEALVSEFVERTGLELKEKEIKYASERLSGNKETFGVSAIIKFYDNTSTKLGKYKDFLDL